jgi:hypothetical protein
MAEEGLEFELKFLITSNEKFVNTYTYKYMIMKLWPFKKHGQNEDTNKGIRFKIKEERPMG